VRYRIPGWLADFGVRAANLSAALGVCVPNAAKKRDDLQVQARDLYSRWTLDCLVEMAYAVSLDFVARPQMYVDDSIPDNIADLRLSYGSSVHYPNLVARQSMMQPILGRSDALNSDGATASSFQVARNAFVAACVAYCERAPDTRIAPLEDRVRSTVQPLRAHFESLHGKAMSVAHDQLKDVFQTAIRILCSPGVATVFGQNPTDEGWPFGPANPSGAKLVAALSAALPLSDESKFTFSRFNVLQRVANDGAHCLFAAVAENGAVNDDLAELISTGYAWGSALRDLQQAP
jgi:hypothetical protein